MENKKKMEKVRTARKFCLILKESGWRGNKVSNGICWLTLFFSKDESY